MATMTSRLTRSDDTVKIEIMEAIAKCEDDSMRALLIIVHKSMEALSEKIDAMLTDEAALKELVLNGVTDGHAQDHLDWRAFKATRPEGKCPYVVMMERQEENRRADRRRIGLDITSKLLWASLGILGCLLVLGFKSSIGL